MKTAILTLFALLLPATITAKATLTLEGASTDSTITVKYVVPESSHVQVRIVSTGGILAAPQYGFQASGNYTIVLDKSGFPRGDYLVQLILDRDRDLVTRRSFLHSPSGRPITRSRQTLTLYNRSFISTMFDPKQAVKLWNELLTGYPDYTDRGGAFLHSIPARMSATDSIDVHTAADSAAALFPYPGTYLTIGRFLSGLEVPAIVDVRYPETALLYAERAVKHIGDVPEPYRNEALYRCLHLRGYCLQLMGSFDEAETAYNEAVETLTLLEGAGTYSDFQQGVWAHEGLASLYEARGMPGRALEFYEAAVRGKPWDPALWMALQRNFNLAHGSDEGYEAYSRKLEEEIPGGVPEKQDDLVGKPLPGFTLTRLSGDTLTLEQTMGNVSVLNFWAFWCGPCMAELPVIARLARETAGSGVKVIAVHTPLESVPGISKDQVPKLVRNTAGKYEGTFETVWDSKEQSLYVQTGTKSLPVTLVADREGIVRYRMGGFDPENAYRKLKAVVDSLSGPSAAPR